MGETEISWTHQPGTVGRTWNPVQGCRRISPGCEHCYAERIAARFCESGWSQGLINITTRKWNGAARLAAHKLDEPLGWRKPSTVFVNSMSDLFYEGFSNEQIAAVFNVIAATPQHTYQVLTKRAGRLREWFEWARQEAWEVGEDRPDYGLMLGGYTGCELGDGSSEDEERQQNRIEDLIADAWARDGADGGTVWDCPWPLPNVWIGVSVENQRAADERIPQLLATPAAVRFLSCEPLLERVDLGWHLDRRLSNQHGDPLPTADIDWVIAGCESGHDARPCDVAWLRSLRDQCAAAGVAYFLKQGVEDLGDGAERCRECGEDVRFFVYGPRDTSASCGCCVEGPESCDWHPPLGFGDGSRRKHHGVIDLPYLDGVQHKEFPNA